MNRVILIGRISSDIKLRTTQTNLQVATFSIAINRPLNKNNESVADFINCQVWGNQASNLVQYQKKGSKIAIDGSIRVNNWQDDKGKHSMTYVLCDRIEYLEKVNNQTSQETYSQYQTRLINSKEPQGVQGTDPYAQMGMQVKAEEIQLSDDQLPF